MKAKTTLLAFKFLHYNEKRIKKLERIFGRKTGVLY